MGESSTVICRKRWLRAYHAAFRRPWSWSWILYGLPTVNKCVYPLPVSGSEQGLDSYNASDELSVLMEYSAVLWLYGEQARAGYGYEGDGGESKSGGAAVRGQHVNALHARCCIEKLTVQRGVLACVTVVQFRQS